MSLSPYLNFPGTAAQAIAFYAWVFGDPAPVISRFSDDPGAGLPGDGVMYGHVRVAGGLVRMSDYPPGLPPQAQAGVSVFVGLPDADSAEAVFEALCDGGQVTMPFEATFWSDAFGMVRDRFGTHWMVSVEEEADDDLA